MCLLLNNVHAYSYTKTHIHTRTHYKVFLDPSSVVHWQESHIIYMLYIPVELNVLHRCITFEYNFALLGESHTRVFESKLIFEKMSKWSSNITSDSVLYCLLNTGHGPMQIFLYERNQSKITRSKGKIVLRWQKEKKKKNP